MRDDQENILVGKAFDFSLNIIDSSEELRPKHTYKMYSRIFKSGTSMGLIPGKPRMQSNADFIHKFK